MVVWGGDGADPVVAVHEGCGDAAGGGTGGCGGGWLGGGCGDC